MKALLALMVVVGVLMSTSAAHALEGHYTKRQRQMCKFIGKNGRWSKPESRDEIRCVAAKIREVSADDMLRVAACESGFNSYAVSSSGTFRGLFQHHADYWLGRVRAAQSAARRVLGDRLRLGVFNARSNSFVTAWMVQREDWSDWSCA